MRTRARASSSPLGARGRLGLDVGLLLAVLGSTAACSSSSIKDKGGDGTQPDAPDGKTLSVSIDPVERAFVELATPSVLALKGAGDQSIAWDLAFAGRNVFSNGGVSGPGNASAFGPLSPPTFLSDTAPDVPLRLQDRAGGAFLDWYKYEGQTHELYSRYHVYGLRDGDHLYKLQVLSYYTEQAGAPVAAHYRIRYAELQESAVLATHELPDIDASAGGEMLDPSAPSACLELETEAISPLTAAEAATDASWQLCFRRDSIAVNGGVSGPRGVEAVDLQADETSDETAAAVEKRTAASELAAFDAIDFAALADKALVYTSDGVATAFGNRWLEPGSDPPTLSDTVWFVVAADGASNYLVKFESLAGDPSSDTAQLSLRVKAVR